MSTITPSMQPMQSQQPTYTLSPEAKSTLSSGLMASVLGGLWFAPTKIAGADALMNMDKDTFEKTGKYFSKLADNSPEKAAFETIRQFRENIENNLNTFTDKVFKNKDKLSIKELFQTHNKHITNIAQAEEQIKCLNNRLEKMDLFKIFPNPEKLQDGITKEHLAKLDELIPDKGAKKILAKFKADFKTKFPLGKKFTTEELANFIKNYYTPLDNAKENLNLLSRIANAADDSGIITKTSAQKPIKRYMMDNILDYSKECFETLKSKLPKARLKGAAKWFGLGIAVSIASNMIFGLFRGKSKN